MATTIRSCRSPIPPFFSAELLKNSTLKVYEQFPNGMCTTHADVINPALLRFIRS
jgi:non-heme chloroperoxidase